MELWNNGQEVRAYDIRQAVIMGYDLRMDIRTDLISRGTNFKLNNLLITFIEFSSYLQKSSKIQLL